MRAGLLALVVIVTFSMDGNAFSHRQRVRGASIYAAMGCEHCHSIRGTGGKKGPDLSGVGKRLNKEQIREQIVGGSNRMPPFGDDLQDKELSDLIAFLHSCRDMQR